MGHPNVHNRQRDKEDVNKTVIKKDLVKEDRIKYTKRKRLKDEINGKKTINKDKETYSLIRNREKKDKIGHRKKYKYS